MNKERAAYLVIFIKRQAGNRDGNGPTIHLPVPDLLEESLERLKQAGGSVISPIIEIPAGRFAYCLDPDGTSLGLFSR
ncbi:MAG: hypothetical protein R3D29_03170 [Nitratireductor sp.]